MLASPRSMRSEAQLGTSLNPRLLRIIGTHLSTRADLVLACLALAMWKMCDFFRPGESAANAALRAAFHPASSAALQELGTLRAS